MFDRHFDFAGLLQPPKPAIFLQRYLGKQPRMRLLLTICPRAS
jgi:hypothetical protein